MLWLAPVVTLARKRKEHARRSVFKFSRYRIYPISVKKKKWEGLETWHISSEHWLLFQKIGQVQHLIQASPKPSVQTQEIPSSILASEGSRLTCGT